MFLLSQQSASFLASAHVVIRVVSRNIWHRTFPLAKTVSLLLASAHVIIRVVSRNIWHRTFPLAKTLRLKNKVTQTTTAQRCGCHDVVEMISGSSGPGHSSGRVRVSSSPPHQLVAAQHQGTSSRSSSYLTRDYEPLRMPGMASKQEQHHTNKSRRVLGPRQDGQR